MADPGRGQDRSSEYGRGARILSAGLATTGLVTFAYFSVSSHVLSDDDYANISLLWSVLFVTVTVLYRPIEQLLSRTIADRRARGIEHDLPLRVPLLLQGGFALVFLVVALLLRAVIRDQLLGESEALYWILIVAVLAYAASYFARGWLAGHQWFTLYGGLVFLESTSRLMFAAGGRGRHRGRADRGRAGHGRRAAVLAHRGPARVPQADRPRGPATARPADDLGLARGGRFAFAVLLIMLAEQTLVNAAVLTTKITAQDAAVAGFVFNVLLIVRAPLTLFQAIQGSLLPHLAGLEAGEDRAAAAPRGADHAPGHRGLRGGRGARAARCSGPGRWTCCSTTARPTAAGGWRSWRVGMGLHLAAGTLQPGGPGARPRHPRGARLAPRRGRLRRLARRAGDRRRAAPRGGRLRGRRRAALRPARRRLLRSPRRVRSGGHGLHP